MPIRELADIGESLFELVSTIQGLGENYFRADATWNDAAWDEISSQVTLLRATLDGLEVMLKRYGLAAASLLEAVKEENKLLNVEEERLEKRRAESEASTCTCFSICRMPFCASLETHLGVAKDAYKPISHNLITQLQIYKVLKELERASSLSFHIDSRYVPLHASEKMVFSTLESGQEPCVVLLCGEPGKGKSTLARQVSLRYRDENSPFTQVVMLECGPRTDVVAKQTQLLQKLGQGWAELFEENELNVMKLLRTHFRKQKLLIILDNLWERDLMDSLLNLSESGVKFLITSQFADICDNLSSKVKTLVLIENLKQDYSRKLLATHAGFEDQNIPRQLQELADEVIVQAESNPLVLVTLGTQITKAEKDVANAWNNVLLTLRADGAQVNVHGIIYPKSFLAAIRISVDSLSREQKQLLVLVAMCRGPSVSKSAVQFLYSTAVLPGCNWAAFRTLSNLLKSRHLLAEMDPEFLSIHSLTKSFILEQMAHDVTDVQNLLEEATSVVKEKASYPTIRMLAIVTCVLIDLYIDAESIQRAAAQDHSPYLLVWNEFSKCTIESKKDTSETIIQLFVLETNSSNKWTEELTVCAYQVFVDFVCNDLLRDSDISKLLASSAAINPILTFLKNAYLIEGSFWEKNFVQSFSSIPYSLLCILRDSSCAKYQTGAALILADLSWCHKVSSRKIANVSGMLSQFAMSLTQVQNPDLQRNAAIALSGCAYWHALDSHDPMVAEILNVSGLLDSLVDLLAKDENPGVQDAAAHALGNLALAKDATIKEILVIQPGLLARLGDSLLRSENPSLQEHAAQALWNLIEVEDQAIYDKILNHPGLVDNLVWSSMPGQSPRASPLGQHMRRLGTDPTM